MLDILNGIVEYLHVATVFYWTARFSGIDLVDQDALMVYAQAWADSNQPKEK